MKLGTPSAAPGSNAKQIALAFGLLLSLSVLARADEALLIESALLTLDEAVEAPAPEAGLLRDFTVREGDTVDVGQVIGRVDPREAELAAELTREDLRVAEREAATDVRVRLADKEQRVAAAELARAESVNAVLPNTVSEKEIDRLQLAVEKSALAIESAELDRELAALRLGRLRAELRLAEHRAERLRIASPIDGVVVECYKRAGEWVDRGEAVARVVRVDRLRVEGYVGAAAAIDGLVGRSVTTRTTLPDGRVVEGAGEVVFVSPEVEPANSQSRFIAEIANDELTLRPGLPTSVAIHAAPPAATASAQ